MAILFLLSLLLVGCSSIPLSNTESKEVKEVWERSARDRQFLDRRPYMEKEQRKP